MIPVDVAEHATLLHTASYIDSNICSYTDANKSYKDNIQIQKKLNLKKRKTVVTKICVFKAIIIKYYRTCHYYHLAREDL